MIRTSIVRRLTSWYAVSFILIFSFGSTALYFSLNRILVHDKAKLLQDHYESAAHIMEAYPDGPKVLATRISEWSMRSAVRVYAKVVDSNSQVIAVSPSLPEEVAQHVFPRMKPQSYFDPMTSGQIISVPGKNEYMTLAQTNPNFTMYVAVDLSSDQEVLNLYKRAFYLILGVMFLASLVIGARLAKLSFRPVQDIIDATNRISSVHLKERIDETKLPAELASLAKTINKMIERMENTFLRLDRFTADIAHEMRTPLNNMRGEIEVSLQQGRSGEEYREVVYSVLEEIQRLSQMIDALLFLAKADSAHMPMDRERFNVKEELANIIDLYEASASEENLIFLNSIDPEVFLTGERTLFQRAVANLISNAISNTPEKGKVSLRVSKNQDKVEVTVEDSGRGIASDDLKKVYDRFYRADPSRTSGKFAGFGLGLTIVKSIMNLFEGEVAIESELHRGTKVTLTFSDKNVMGQRVD